MRKVLTIKLLFMIFITAIVITFRIELCAEAPGELLTNLRNEHPRLILTEERLSELKERHETDSTLQKYLKDVIDDADEDLEKPVLTYKKIGPRLLSVSRECLDRIYTLGLAYRWTNDDRYAEKALQNLYAVCSFQDWNPSHFLDTAEMSHAVGIGYDWLYHYMMKEDRDFIRQALVDLGMKPGLTAYNASDPAWWVNSKFNWNQVCNSGLITGVLAIAETHPDIATTIITEGVKSIPVALRTYGPDGVWLEGPGYWHYATRYTAYGIAALNTALRTDFNLTDIPGLEVTGGFPIYTTGPTNLFLNFADSGEWRKRNPMACLFWLAAIYDEPFFANAEHEILIENQAEPEHVIWYFPQKKSVSSRRSLDRIFDGDVQVAVFRSSWEDPDALFVGVKSGYNQVNHGHLDLGNFEIDALGVRWARDLGSDDYNLPGYWEMGPDGKRWEYYRLNSRSHNVPLLNNENQDVMANTSFIRSEVGTEAPFVIVDLTDAYQKSASKVHRGVKLVESRRAVLVQDEFRLKQRTDIAWGMTTDAKIQLITNKKVVLKLDDKNLYAHILSPGRAKFHTESARQNPPQKPNNGVNRLIVRLPGQRRDKTISVLLTPVWDDGGSVESTSVEPLVSW